MTRPDTIYATRPIGMDGPIKIGVTCDVERRMRHINNASPFPMELLGTTAGDVILERRIHHALIASHLRCEWFDPTSDVLAMVDAIKRDDLPIDDLPAPRGVASFINGKPAYRAPERKAS